MKVRKQAQCDCVKRNRTELTQAHWITRAGPGICCEDDTHREEERAAVNLNLQRVAGPDPVRAADQDEHLVRTDGRLPRRRLLHYGHLLVAAVPVPVVRGLWGARRDVARSTANHSASNQGALCVLAHQDTDFIEAPRLDSLLPHRIHVLAVRRTTGCTLR